jgi:hypothetical protein
MSQKTMSSEVNNGVCEAFERFKEDIAGINRV